MLVTIYGQSEELVSRCVECDLAEPESLGSLGGSVPGLIDGILSLPINWVAVILFWIICVLKVWTNRFQEVLEVVLFGAWIIPPTAHGWLLCGRPTRVSTTFILSVGKILFELTCISNNV